MSDNNIIITDEYQDCLNNISMDTPVIFVNGRAGTGKSVLIEVIEEQFPNKEIVKVAPTGIAALNIYGQTIHSVFRLPAGVLSFEAMKSRIRKMWDFDNGVMENLDLLIIDEISMVRADMLDAIDQILRAFRDRTKPFGGVQVVLIGDLFQLPPVLVDDERPTFQVLYPSEFFFSSDVIRLCFERNQFKVITLTKSFRHDDETFIMLLNNMRLNRNKEKVVNILNACCYDDPGNSKADENTITLCTTNFRAGSINDMRINKLEGQLHTYNATITGKFNLKLLTPETLHIKIGAKVMFTRNSDNWANGSMGIVEGVSDEGIHVRVLDSDTVFIVGTEKWEIIRSNFNRKIMRMEETVTGSFRQYPLTLAWAVTIHKSQGLTFDSVILDLGKEAFATGQTYVGFSRCRTLDGITLARPLEKRDIKVNRKVVNFFKSIDEMDAVMS